MLLIELSPKNGIENVPRGTFNLDLRIGTSRRNRDVWQRWASVIIAGSSGSLLLCHQGRIQYGLPSAAPAPVVYREGRACGCARGVGGAAASPERIPARLGTPPRAPPPARTLTGSYVFVQRFLLFPAALVLFFWRWSSRYASFISLAPQISSRLVLGYTGETNLIQTELIVYCLNLNA